MPLMYTDLWTGAKEMYNVEPFVSDSGEVVVYAPRVSELSHRMLSNRRESGSRDRPNVVSGRLGCCCRKQLAIHLAGFDSPAHASSTRILRSMARADEVAAADRTASPDFAPAGTLHAGLSQSTPSCLPSPPPTGRAQPSRR
jgi:hypothetical protein